MSHKAIPVLRGCGTRESGALYLEVGMGPGGRPIEEFLIDPPVRVDAEALGLSAIGVKLVKEPTRDVYHVFDIVGSEHYPNLADFIEEARRFGISRRISQNTEFAKLTEESRLVLLHARGWVDRADSDYFAVRELHGLPWDCCPTAHKDHGRNFPPPEMCASVWWEDVEGGTPLDPPENDGRRVKRTMPSFDYTACAPPPHLTKITRRLAIFARFPISRLVAVKDRHGDKHERAAERARASRLPVEYEDQ